MRSVLMHGGLSHQMRGRPVMRWAAMNPRSVRELDAKQQNHLQQRGGSGKHIAEALHTRGNNTPALLFKQRDRTIFGLRLPAPNRFCKRRSARGAVPVRDD